MTTASLATGLVLGLSAGLAPGPLLTLVIAETLRHDVRSGIRVALAPLITDLPIILATLFVLSRLARFEWILGAIALAGSAFVLSMGYASLRTQGLALPLRDSAPKSWMKGVLANALSPHPYLFWLSVGGPLMTKAWALSPIAPLLFLGGFYTALVGAKILLALAVGRSKVFLTGPAYLLIMRLLGALLVVLAAVLLVDGLALLGWTSG